ncbi:MAG: RNA polymerase sigma factor [Planctomycetes bacterium]|nr:RNA polymerase sigma factor [Planctomycetota bacterium]
MTQPTQSDAHCPSVVPDSSTAGAQYGEVGWAGLEEHRGSLQRFLVGRSVDENDINDIIQESFMRAARYRTAPMETGRMRGWLIRIAGNVHVDKLRSRSRGPITGLPMEIWENIRDREPQETRFSWGGGEVVMEEALQCLDSAGSEIPGQDRDVLDEYYIQQAGTHEIAGRLGVTASMVKVRLFRARRRLRSLLERQFRLVDDPAFAWA